MKSLMTFSHKIKRGTGSHWQLALLLIPALLLASCETNATETPTPDGSVILTNVAGTIAAELTGTASAMPTATPTETPAPSATLLPTNTLPPLLPPASSGSSSTYTSGVTACDQAGFMADVTIPDGTGIGPGASFTKTWQLSNTGTCTWNSSYTLIYYSGTQMSGTTQSFPTDSVAPGGSVELSVTLTAPTSAGTYTGYWALKNASGAVFGIGSAGEPFYVQIVVSSSATTTTTPTPTSTSDGSTATATATPTATSTTAATSAATSTTAPTATSVPTTAPTTAPTATSDSG